MCRFLSLDFEYTLKCPVDKENHTVRFQAYPQLRQHPLDVVECDAKPQVDQLTCGAYWQRTYPESAVYSHSQ